MTEDEKRAIKKELKEELHEHKRQVAQIKHRFEKYGIRDEEALSKNEQLVKSIRLKKMTLGMKIMETQMNASLPINCLIKEVGEENSKGDTVRRFIMFNTKIV